MAIVTVVASASGAPMEMDNIMDAMKHEMDAKMKQCILQSSES